MDAKVRLRIKKIDSEVRVTILEPCSPPPVLPKYFHYRCFCYGKDQANVKRQRGERDGISRKADRIRSDL